MPSGLIVLDTNILLRWVQHDSPHYAMVRDAVTRLSAEGCVGCYTSQILGEFWNVLTRPPERNGYGLEIPRVVELAQAISDEFVLMPDDLAIHLQWLELLKQHRVRGVQVHDARIAAYMYVFGVSRILTFNARDFARFPGIEVLDPAALAAA